MFLNIVEEYMFTVGIITSSDKGYSGEREDKSGKVIEEIVSENGFKVIKKVVLPDEKTLLENEMINMCDNLNVNLLLTTGGTGFSKRDITPEATRGGGAGNPQCSSRGRPGFRGTLWVASRVPSALSTSNS